MICGLLFVIFLLLWMNFASSFFFKYFLFGLTHFNSTIWTKEFIEYIYLLPALNIFHLSRHFLLPTFSHSSSSSSPFLFFSHFSPFFLLFFSFFCILRLLLLILRLLLLTFRFFVFFSFNLKLSFLKIHFSFSQ